MHARKAVLVTAASAGVGAAVARVLAMELGMSIIINYAHNADRANKLVEELRAAWREKLAEPSSSGMSAPASDNLLQQPVFAAVQADLAERGQVLRLVEDAAKAAGGRLDAVVSNVGWTRVRNFADLDDGVDEDDWDRCFAVNVKSHLWLFHAARPWLEASHARENGAAVFVSTASVAGCYPSGSSLPYAVTKAAQIHLVKSLATISAPVIRVNSISPGLLMTDWGLSFPQERREKMLQKNCLGRFATVEDVAEQVRVFVKSKSVTGQNVVIDAGFSLP